MDTVPVPIKTVFDVFAAAEHAALKLKCRPWWRGQGDIEWRLQPAIYREDCGPGYEQNIANLFKARAPARYEKSPAHDDLARWLFLMQHYRLPTRLLDWTESVFVAVFFAVTDCPSRAGALWALNPYALSQSQTGCSVVFNPRGENLGNMFSAAFREVPQPDDALALALPIWPEEIDFRMVVQHSAFTIHGHPNPLEDLACARNCVRKYEIPSEAKPDLRHQLDTLGFRESTLFPDLENLAKSLASQRTSPPSSSGCTDAADGS